MRRQSGFTLIEALTTGAISSIVGLALLSVLYMTNGQIKEGTATLRLARLQNVATEQIHRSARQAMAVWQQGTTPTANFAFNQNLSPEMSGVIFCDPTGDTLAGYSVSGDLLKELDTASGTWIPFEVAGDTVTVDEDSSYFKILNNRHGMVSRIRYTLVDGDSLYAFPPIADTIRCRNTIL
jgi:type II secretory pathway pseudopilin PulG